MHYAKSASLSKLQNENYEFSFEAKMKVEVQISEHARLILIVGLEMTCHGSAPSGLLIKGKNLHLGKPCDRASLPSDRVIVCGTC